ncbi:MAG: porin family protein [Ferruginibacter sp.]
MHKYLIVLFLIVTSTGFSQSSKVEEEHENFFRFGLKGGVNINKVNGKAFKKAYSYNFQAGAFLQFNFSKRFGIQPEVNFVQASAEISNNSNDVYDDLFGGGDQNKAKLNYLDVPVLLNVNLGPSKRVKLQVGPSYGFLLKQSVDSLKTNANIYKNGEWSAVGGIWFQLPVVHIGARYKYGLTNINAIDKQESWHNQALQIFIGLTF